MPELDLLVLVADNPYKKVLTVLLSERRPSLKIRTISYEIVRHPRSDPGTFNDPISLLRPFSNITPKPHVLVLLDYEGSGQENRLTPDEMQLDIETRLKKVGWESCTAVVVSPEIELWVWSQSPEVKTVLGYKDEDFKAVLQKYPLDSQGKPNRPKEALQTILAKGKRPASFDVYNELARKVSLTRTQERSFSRLRETLQNWFSDLPPQTE